MTATGFQNLGKWLSVHLQIKWLWVRILLLSHNEHEKLFRSTAGSYLLIELYFFQYSLKSSDTAAVNRNKNTLEAFTGISFFHIYEMLLCKFF